jgi:hypothetical protein
MRMRIILCVLVGVPIVAYGANRVVPVVPLQAHPVIMFDPEQSGWRFEFRACAHLPQPKHILLAEELFKSLERCVSPATAVVNVLQKHDQVEMVNFAIKKDDQVKLEVVGQRKPDGQPIALKTVALEEKG